jgi:hypothetical protein
MFSIRSALMVVILLAELLIGHYMPPGRQHDGRMGKGAPRERRRLEVSFDDERMEVNK